VRLLAVGSPLVKVPEVQNQYEGPLKGLGLELAELAAIAEVVRALARAAYFALFCRDL
jgi:hypothetical protein